MLEILAWFILCRHIGKLARAKGRAGLGYQFLLVALWILGEFVGGLVGGIALLVYAAYIGPPAEEAVIMPYVVALIGAVLGAKLAFRIVRGLPDQNAAEPAQFQENFVSPGIDTGGTDIGTFQS